MINSNIIIYIVLFTSIILGIIKFNTIENTKSWSWQHKFLEIWNCIINFLLSGLVGYYFIIVRWPMLLSGKALEVSDFFLFIIFAVGLFGHLNVLSYNITEGIQAILKRVFEK